MTRATKLNKVVKIAAILSVDIRPLNNTGFVALFAAALTFVWLALLPPDPLMESSIADTLAFPGVILLVLYLSSLNFRPLSRPLVSSLKPASFVSHNHNCRGKFGTMQVW